MRFLVFSFNSSKISRSSLILSLEYDLMQQVAVNSVSGSSSGETVKENFSFSNQIFY